jgi:hypothetical protein
MATGQPNSLPNLTTSFAFFSALASTGHALDAGLRGGEARRDLVAHDLDGFGRGTDEGHAARRDGARELGVLREEAVPRVHGVGAGAVDDVKDRLGVEVALGGALAAERVGLVGQAHVQRVAIEFGVDGDGGDAHLSTGAHDAHRDLAAIGDQDFL